MIAGKGVWATADFGINWGLTNRGLSSLASAGNLNDLTYAFNGKLYLATARGLYEKDLAGKMWAKTSKTSFGNENLVSLLLTESNPDTLWINTEDEGVFIYRIEEED
jgi:ligand-binding sensor domain-containing protein